jgi:DNA-binding transcriptional LysR family regulator
MEKIEDMHLLVEVVHSGSFSEAARRNGLSVTSVSRRINALEDSLSVRLLDRAGRRVALTEIGKIYFERSERILADARELSELVAGYRSSPRGSLNVHTRPGMVSQQIARALPAFLERYPEIDVNFWTSDLYVSSPVHLLEHSIDIAIWLGRPPDSSLAIRVLTQTPPRVLFASRHYVDTHDPITAPENLLSHNCLTWFDREFDARPPVWRFRDGDGGEIELRVQGTLKSNNIEILRTAALSGLGIGLLPEWAVADEVEAGDAVRILPGYQVTPTTFDPGIYAVYQKVRHTPRPVREFIEFMREHLAAEPGARPSSSR